METAEYFHQKAEQCRRWANALPNQNDPIVANLVAMSDEFEERAAADRLLRQVSSRLYTHKMSITRTVRRRVPLSGWDGKRPDRLISPLSL